MGWVIFILWCLGLCHHDIRWRRLPDRWTVGGAVVTLSCAALGGELPWAVAGAALWFLVYLGLALTGAVGGGDVKFALGLGAWVGWASGTPAAVVCAILVAAVVSGATALMSRTRTVPHGPAMVAGCLTSIWLFCPRIPWESFA